MLQVWSKRQNPREGIRVFVPYRSDQELRNQYTAKDGLNKVKYVYPFRNREMGKKKVIQILRDQAQETLERVKTHTVGSPDPFPVPA